MVPRRTAHRSFTGSSGSGRDGFLMWVHRGIHGANSTEGFV